LCIRGVSQNPEEEKNASAFFEGRLMPPFSFLGFENPRNFEVRQVIRPGGGEVPKALRLLKKAYSVNTGPEIIIPSYAAGGNTPRYR
jgi:hypothetical protein